MASPKDKSFSSNQLTKARNEEDRRLQSQFEGFFHDAQTQLSSAIKTMNALRAPLFAHLESLVANEFGQEDSATEGSEDSLLDQSSSSQSEGSSRKNPRSDGALISNYDSALESGEEDQSDDGDNEGKGQNQATPANSSRAVKDNSVREAPETTKRQLPARLLEANKQIPAEIVMSLEELAAASAKQSAIWGTEIERKIALYDLADDFLDDAIHYAVSSHYHSLLGEDFIVRIQLEYANEEEGGEPEVHVEFKNPRLAQYAAYLPKPEGVGEVRQLRTNENVVIRASQPQTNSKKKSKQRKKKRQQQKSNQKKKTHRGGRKRNRNKSKAKPAPKRSN